MREMRTLVAGLCVAVVLLVPMTLGGATGPDDTARVREGLRLIESLNKQLAKVYADLQKNSRSSNRRARGQCKDLLRIYMRTMKDNSFAPRFFGYTLFFKAVADHRLGHRRDALWEWQVAQDVLPELRSKEFGNFPDVAQFLEDNRVARQKPEPEKDPKVERGEEGLLRAPKILSGPKPAFPKSLRTRGFLGRAIVECVIDTEGTTHEPRLVTSSGVTAADVAALLVLERWRFRPATRDGRPIPARYVLTVNFKVP